jgi:hypothetical protein
MRVSIRPGRSRILAIAASVLLSGAALATATVPAQASSGAAAALAANVITVTPPAASLTAPYDVPFPLQVDVQESDATAQLTVSVTETPALPAADTVTVAPAQPAPSAEAIVVVTATLPTAYTGVISVSATDGTSTGAGSFGLTAKNHVIMASIANQTDPVGTTITPLQASADDTDTAAPRTPNNTLAYTDTGLTAAGLAIDPDTGLITGKTGKAGTFPITVTATDGTGATDTATFTWTVGNTITVTAPKSEATELGLPVTVQATAADSGTSQTVTWSAKPLPPGLSISKTGLISGRTTAAGAFKTVVTATDGTGSAGTATIAWNVGTPITVHSAGSVTTTAGRSVGYKLTYSDVVKGDKVTWTAAGLPAGVGFQPSSLLLYGWPATAGTHTVTFKAKGSLGPSDQKVLKLVVKAAPNQGATGQIHLALDGKCLQDPGNRTANGTRAEIENCVSGATERWTVASDNTIRANGHCLNIAGSGGSNGRQLQLWNCNGSTRQVWLQESAGQLVNPASGLCVTDPGSSRVNGATPTMGACHARSFEQWTLPAQPVFTAVGGRCMDDPLGRGYNGTVIDMYACNNTPGQAWNFEPNGTIKISQYANVCVTMHKGQPVLWVCGAAGDQKWSVNRTGGLGSELTVGGACLATKSLTAGNAVNLVMTKCSAGNPLDLWHIE